jgi:hypothetical protein
MSATSKTVKTGCSKPAASGSPAARLLAARSPVARSPTGSSAAPRSTTAATAATEPAVAKGPMPPVPAKRGAAKWGPGTSRVVKPAAKPVADKAPAPNAKGHSTGKARPAGKNSGPPKAGSVAKGGTPATGGPTRSAPGKSVDPGGRRPLKPATAATAPTAPTTKL